MSGIIYIYEVVWVCLGAKGLLTTAHGKSCRIASFAGALSGLCALFPETYLHGSVHEFPIVLVLQQVMGVYAYHIIRYPYRLCLYPIDDVSNSINFSAKMFESPPYIQKNLIVAYPGPCLLPLPDCVVYW